VSDLYLGIEIGGTKLQLALGTGGGSLKALHQGSVDVEKGGAGIRTWLVDNIPGFIERSGYTFRQIQAIGCGFGGPIDRNAGKVLASIQIPGWQDFQLRNWLEETFDRPAWVENDANAATWGEYRQGFGRGTQHFFYTNLGSGVGGGFVFEGKLYDGQGFGAGEFGHTYIPDLTHNGAGKPIKVEHVCSGWAIENRLRRPGYIPESSELFLGMNGESSQITTRDLAAAARHGDSFALAEIDLVAHSLGIGLVNVLSLTNVERIAIGGGVSNLGDLLIDPVRKYTEQYCFISSQGRYQIQQSELGDSIVLVGAVLLAKEMLAGAQHIDHL
jgi:glucokinase